jgi:hypothetical protein
LTIVALVVLIAIWGVFLGVTLVRKRAEYRADSSIGAFQRQLQVLRRNSAVSKFQGNSPGEQFDPVSTAGRPAPDRSTDEDPFFRPEARERRRDVLLILVSLVVSTGLISIIPAARIVLVLTGIAAALLAAYVALLVRSQARATERIMKLRYMPRIEEPPVAARTFSDRRVIAR